MKKIKNNLFLLLLFIVILAGLFYWYEVRPSTIRSSCYKTASDKLDDNFSKIELFNRQQDKSTTFRDGVYAHNFYYNNCLRKHGLKTK